jgi:4-amino-4-deoxy-L-arabinose transferase-like glycosyltransferase
MTKRKKNRLRSQPSLVAAPSTGPASDAPPSGFSIPSSDSTAAASTAPALNRAWLVALVVLFLVTRLINLDTFPLHGDESTYIYWGQIAASSPDQRFISMWGGRQPLHTWIVAALVPLVDSILVPARLISVVAGAFTALGVCLLARRLFSNRVAYLATLLYILSPYTAQFDRQVFQDGMIAAEATWMLYLSVLTFERPRWPVSIGLGVVAGLALLTKSTSWLFIPLIVFAFLPFPRAEWKSRALKAAPHLIAALLIGGALYFALFGSSSAAADLGYWTSIFTYSIPELLGFPVGAWGDNLGAIVRWLATYLTLPIFLLLLVALEAIIVWLSRLDDPLSDRPARTVGRKVLLVAIWGLIPTLAHVILAKGLYARYIVFVVPPLLILVALVAERIVVNLSRQPPLARYSPPIVAAGLIALLIALPAYQTATLIFAPASFNFDAADRGPYYDGALWARLPLADYLRAAAEQQPVTLLTNVGMNPVLTGQMATLPHSQTGIRLSPLWPLENGKLYPFDPLSLQPLSPDAIQSIRQTHSLYGAVPGEEEPLAEFITPLTEFPDKAGQIQVRLYTIDFDRYLAWLGQ